MLPFSSSFSCPEWQPFSSPSLAPKAAIPFRHQLCAYGNHISRIHWLLVGISSSQWDVCMHLEAVCFSPAPPHSCCLCGSGESNELSMYICMHIWALPPCHLTSPPHLSTSLQSILGAPVDLSVPLSICSDCGCFSHVLWDHTGHAEEHEVSSGDLTWDATSGWLYFTDLRPPQLWVGGRALLESGRVKEITVNEHSAVCPAVCLP